MLSARWIMGGVAVMVLRIFGAVLGVLQVAVALELNRLGLRGIGAVSQPSPKPGSCPAQRGSRVGPSL